MALLNHSSINDAQKNGLTRGRKINVNNKVNRTDIDKGSKATTPKDNITISSVITEPVNIRVDNHIRNKIAALITMGHSDSQKEMVEMLVNIYTEGLENSELKRYEDLVQIYENKDLMKYQKKQNNS